MKRLLILGAGTAGTIVANRLRPRLPVGEWKLTIIDQEATHYYQPGFVFIPFGIYREEDVVKPKRRFLPDNVELILGEIELVEPEHAIVRLTNGQTVGYDYLVIATGVSPRPEETLGLVGEEWYRSIFDFHTYQGSVALAKKLADWPGGQLVVNVMEMPIKGAAAPLEMVFLADWFFREKGMRDKVEISYALPQPDAFSRPIAAQMLNATLSQKGIKLLPEFYVDHVDQLNKQLVGFDERELPFDLLLTVPVNVGADFIGRSNLGDHLNLVPVDKHTLLSLEYDNIFVLGDAAALPAMKASTVAHYAAELFVDNFLRYTQGQSLLPSFDGHANFFVETGYDKAILLDLNYDLGPLPGKFPHNTLGPAAVAARIPAKPLGQTRLSLDLLERHAAWTAHAIAGSGRDRRRRRGARPLGSREQSLQQPFITIRGPGDLAAGRLQQPFRRHQPHIGHRHHRLARDRLAYLLVEPLARCRLLA